MLTVAECAQRGVAALDGKDFDAAIAAFSRALELEPGRPDMTHALGMAHMHRGDVGTAVEHLERAVSLAEPYTHPENQPLKREFHDALATAYQVLDRVDDALSVLRGMVERWPDQASARIRLGQLLLASGDVAGGLRVYGEVRHLLVDAEDVEAIDALIGALRAYLDAPDASGAWFLQAHRDAYVDTFDTVAAAQAELGWLAEAARMARRADGEVVPILADGARRYALSRVDLVDPATGEAAAIYSDTDPMIVAVGGLEPLAQLAVLLPWPGHAFEVLVSTQSPWHWLPMTLEFATAEAGGGGPTAGTARSDRVDAILGDWYLAGYNGEFGDRDRGRFHYVSDLEPLGDRALAWVVDLGRARLDAVDALVRRLTVLHDTHPIRRLVLGHGRIPAR